MRLIRQQLTFFAGLAIGVTCLFAIELYEQIRDYQQGRFYE